MYFAGRSIFSVYFFISTVYRLIYRLPALSSELRQMAFKLYMAGGTFYRAVMYEF